MLILRRTIGGAVAGSLVAVAPAPASAADDTAKTGVIAALGLEAASGKTTVGGGAGAIEAGLLSSDAMLRAGAVIASVANQGAAGGRVLVVSRDQQVSLAMVRVVRDRIGAVRDLLARTACPKPPSPPAPAAGQQHYDFRITPNAVTPYLSDVAGAIATETTISPVAFTTDDRMLVNAVLMGRSETRFGASAGAWMSTDAPQAATASRATFVVPGEIADVGEATPTRTLYDQMLRDADKKRGCAGDAIKGAVAAADALATSLNASEKGALSPLVTAMQLDGLLASTASGGKPTYILRVAVEQVGGTAISRSGVLYTLGFPGAAVVSAGVLVSFRLVDPRSGEVVRTGVVRCAVPQTRFGRVRDVVLRARDATACSYRSS